VKQSCSDCLMFETREATGYCNVFMEDLGGDHKTCSDFAPRFPKKNLRLEDLLRPRRKTSGV